MKCVRWIAAVCLSAMILCMFSACQKVPDRPFGFQTEMPEEGDPIAIVHTNIGDIFIRLFPEYAPKTVKNFTTLANEGYYDNVLFHRVIDNFMIQTGDPTGSGMGGESCWGGTFKDEFHPSLGNLYGAVSMANRGEDTNGSQFFINQAGRDTQQITGLRARFESGAGANDVEGCETVEEYVAAFYDLDASKVTEEVLSVYEEIGGNMYLDGPLRESGGHTVFGHVYAGMDLVEYIASVQTSDEDFPLEYLIVYSIEISTYQAQELTTTQTSTETTATAQSE